MITSLRLGFFEPALTVSAVSRSRVASLLGSQVTVISPSPMPDVGVMLTQLISVGMAALQAPLLDTFTFFVPHSRHRYLTPLPSSYRQRQ